MKHTQIQKRSPFSVAILLITTGIVVLIFANGTLFPGGWATLQWVRSSIAFIGLVVILIGVILWMRGSLTIRHGNGIVSFWLRHRIIAPLVIIFIVMGSAVSIGNVVGILNANWLTMASDLSNAFGLIMAFISLPAPETANKGDVELHQRGSGAPLSPEPVNLKVPSNAHGYRDIGSTRLPEIDDRILHMSRKDVVDIYTKLMKPTISALALSDASVLNTSTMAAMVAYKVKLERERGDGPFKRKELWLKITSDITISDIVGTILAHQGVSVVDVSHKTLPQQMDLLIDALNDLKMVRLIVLDGCEHIFKQSDVDSSGVHAFLEAIGGQKCESRLLIACQFLPSRRRNDRLPRLLLYSIPSLALDEYIQSGRDTNSLIDEVYREELDDVQRKVLSALSIYQKEASLAALKRHLPGVDSDLLLSALKGLIEHSWILYDGRDTYAFTGRGFAEYVTAHFMDIEQEEERKSALRKEHMKAYHYYEREIRNIGHVQSSHRTELLLEAIWQLGHAQEWKRMYRLVKKEDFLAYLKKQEKADSVLLVCEWFQKSPWQPDNKTIMAIYEYRSWAIDYKENTR